MKFLQPAGWPRPKGYANGIAASGRIIVTGGVIGWDEEERIVSHRFYQQFAQVLSNIRAILAEDGATMADIVRMTVYVTDIEAYRDERDELGPVWKNYMGDHYPAMALIGVKELVERSALVEIEATAVVAE